MNTSLECRLSILKSRGRMLKKVRSFFEERDVLEVDCPALSHAAPIDAHIDVMKVEMHSAEIGYLHTSPEYGMKRLLAEGLPDIYQLSHVFREGECGTLHNPEFTMIEWYRLGFSFEEMIDETIDMVQLFLPQLEVITYSYRDVLRKYIGIDYCNISLQNLASKALELIPHLPEEAKNWDLDTLLNSLMSFIVEPNLGQNSLCIIKYFPGTQAALSQTKSIEGEFVAERFEVYYQGIELANGYHELTCPIEQFKRFDSSNKQRVALGKSALPIDQHLIKALEKGLPDCCGVAVGFDRLLMLHHHLKSLAEILPFPWPLS